MKKMLMMMLVLASAVAFGGNLCTWTGGSTTAPNDWTDADNWEGGVKPVAGNGDTVVIPNEMAATLNASDTASCQLVAEGGLALIKMMGRPGDRGVTKTGTLIVNVDENDVGLTIHCKTLGYRTADAANADASSGLVIKRGAGGLRLHPKSAGGDYYTSFTVEEGDLYLPQEVTAASNYRTLCVSNNAVLHIPATTGKKYQVAVINLEGSGTLTNSHANGYTDIQIHVTGDCEFSGKLTNLRLFAKSGNLRLTGTESTMTSMPTADYNYGEGPSGNGILGVKKFGMKGEPSSVGVGNGVVFGQVGGVIRYIGEADETTDKYLYWQYPKTQMNFIDGGPHGGLKFSEDSAWADWTSGDTYKGMKSLGLCGEGLAGTNEMAGAIAAVEKDGNTCRMHLTKRGAGIWRIRDHETRDGIGGITVEEGTLQFDSLADRGVMCALGTAVDCHTNYWGEYDANAKVDYAFAAGTATTEGCFEYTGTANAWTATRPMVLNGDVRFRNDGAAAFRFANVTPKTTGGKKLTLDGAGTGENVIADVIDTAAAPISIVKEGAGSWTLANTNDTLHGAVEVKAGTLKLRSPAGKYTWYLWTPKGVVYPDGGEGSDNKPAHLNSMEFLLYRTNDYVRVNKGLTVCSDYAQIQPGQAAYLDHKKHGGSLANLFDGANTTAWNTTVDSKMPRVEDPETWSRVVMRLAEDVPEVAGYDFGCSYGVQQSGLDGRYDMFGCDVLAWTLEGSVDGIHWNLLHKIDNSLDRDCGMPVGLYGNRLYKTQSNQAALLLCSTNSQQIVGHSSSTVNPLAHVTSVKVAKGATLVAEGAPMEVKGLVIDAVDAGTLDNFTFAEEGTLDVLNLPKGGSVELPLEFANVPAEEIAKLANWSLTIGGEVKSSKSIAIRNGKVCIDSSGLMLIFR